MIDPLSRVDLDEMEMLIGQQKYFVLHAPRQTGKTSTLLALREYLNKQGRYVCVYANVESGQAFRNNVEKVVEAFIMELADRLATVVREAWPEELAAEIIKDTKAQSLNHYITQVCARLGRPLVLLIDEIDSLVGDSLVSILRQMRAGYDKRPERYPQSIILCGVRDVRDYRIVLSNQDIITGGSAFNIKAESLRMGNFTREEIRALFNQHTAETGQLFDEGCYDMIWTATEGQPWLVNALGYEVTMKIKENRDRSVRIIPEMIYRAQEQIIYRRDTHIDILIDKLREPRVKRIIEPILAGSENTEEMLKDDDLQYVEDLGLIVREKPVRIANAIYREVIPRELTWTKQQLLVQQSSWYINEDNTINMPKLLAEFQAFYRENAEAWDRHFDYREAGPQLLLQAFLQRVVNGGGYIDREYGLGMKRTDLLIRKPLTDHYGGPVQKIFLELKIRRGALETEIESALVQSYNYLERLHGELNEGHIIIFDRDSNKSWDDKLYRLNRAYKGCDFSIWGM